GRGARGVAGLRADCRRCARPSAAGQAAAHLRLAEGGIGLSHVQRPAALRRRAAASPRTAAGARRPGRAHRTTRRLARLLPRRRRAGAGADPGLLALGRDDGRWAGRRIVERRRRAFRLPARDADHRRGGSAKAAGAVRLTGERRAGPGARRRDLRGRDRLPVGALPDAVLRDEPAVAFRDLLPTRRCRRGDLLLHLGRSVGVGRTSRFPRIPLHWSAVADRRLRRRFQPIPDAVAGLDERVPWRTAGDLVAQAADEDVDGPVAMRLAPAPELLEELVARDDATALERELVQEAELRRRQLSALAVDVRLHLARIDAQLFDLDRLAARGFFPPRRA